MNATAVCRRVRRDLLVATFAVFAGLAGPSLRAQMGVAILSDLERRIHWEGEEMKWSELLQYSARENDLTQRVLDETARLTRITGDPSAEARALVGHEGTAVKPAEEAAALETAKHAIESSRNLFGLGSRAVKTYTRGGTVKPTFEVFGETVEREDTRYAPFAIREALAARARTAGTNEDAVMTAEIGVQKEAIDQLTQARNHAQVAVVHARLAASFQRQSIARQRAAQASADAEAFERQLAVEKARKEEAEREWAETVVRRLKEKALAAYQAQRGAGASP